MKFMLYCDFTLFQTRSSYLHFTKHRIKAQKRYPKKEVKAKSKNRHIISLIKVLTRSKKSISFTNTQQGSKKQEPKRFQFACGIINRMFQNPQTENQIIIIPRKQKAFANPKMGACIQGSKENIIVTPQPARRIKRRVSSIEDVLDPKLCRGGPTNRKSTKIRRNFVGHA